MHMVLRVKSVVPARATSSAAWGPWWHGERALRAQTYLRDPKTKQH